MVLKFSSRLNQKLKNSDLDKLLANSLDVCVFGLWKISIMNLIKFKASLAKNFHVQPSEVDNMPMWEYELFIKELNNQVEEENKDQQAQMDKYGVDKYSKMADPKNMQKMTTMPKFETPRIPNINVKL